VNIVKSIATAERGVLERAFEQRCKTIVLGDYTALTRVLGDLLLYVDTRDITVAPHLLMSGCWEFWVTQAIARHLHARPDGMVCADIGANVGYYTMLMAALVGEKGRVHAFDLLPNNRRLIRRSAEINGFKTVSVHEHAVTDCDADYWIHVPKTTDAFSHLANATLMATSEGMSDDVRPGMVRGRSLDSMDFGERLDFVKIDVEGAEPLVWKGAQETFRRYNPVICMEYELWRTGAAQNVLDLRKSGYRVRYVEHDSSLVELPEQPDPERLYMLWVTR
jgi:FkbM family methyltransferase